MGYHELETLLEPWLVPTVAAFSNQCAMKGNSTELQQLCRHYETDNLSLQLKRKEV